MTAFANNQSMTQGSSYGTPPSDGDDGDLIDRRTRREQLRKTKFDSVSSMLLALLMLVGAGVLMLFIVWWDSRVAKPIKAIQMLGVYF